MMDRWLGRLLVVVALAGAPRVATAECGESWAEGYAVVAYSLLGVVPAGVGALTTGIGNWVDYGDSDGPSRGWIVSGYVFGALGVGVSVLGLGLFLGDDCTSSDAVGVTLAAALPAMALGTFSLVTTALNHAHDRPDRGSAAAPFARSAGRGVKAIPFVLSDDRGREHFGLALGGLF